MGDGVLIFWGTPQVIQVLAEQGRPPLLAFAYYSSLPKFGHQTFSLSFNQLLCSGQILSCIVFVPEVWIMWQSRPQQFLSVAALYTVQFDPCWCQKNLPGLLSTPPEKLWQNVVEQNITCSNFKRCGLKPLLQPKYRSKYFHATADSWKICYTCLLQNFRKSHEDLPLERELGPKFHIKLECLKMLWGHLYPHNIFFQRFQLEVK